MVVAATALSLLLAGCAQDPASQDLCARYADFQKASGELSSAPPLEGTDAEQLQQQVDALRLQADKVKDTLDQIQRVSEGRLDTAIANARLRVDEMRESLVVAKYDAAETLGPKITQAQDNLRNAVAPVVGALATQCT